MELILALEQAAGAPLEQVGGKAKNLGRLLGAGFRVPAGFCVTSRACQEFLAYHRLDPGRVTEKVVANATMPPDIEEAIRAAYEGLAKGGVLWVAVRSSGAAEDSSDMAFAGQFETFLNVTGADEVLEHVRLCWASAWNRRVRAYAPDVTPQIAVVVQEMVPAEKAGVAFTQNPVFSGAPGVLVEAGWGGGECIVSGQVSPDAYLLDRETGRVVEKRVGHKAWMMRPGRRRPEPVAKELQDAEVLSEEELQEVWQQARAVEAAYEEQPQDIEWALSGGRVYLLQTRPITTLSTRPEGNWSRGISDDLWSEALCPLTASIIVDRLGEVYTFQRPARQLGLKPLIRDDVLKVIDNYLYVNADAIADALQLLPPGLLFEDALAILPPGLREGVQRAPRRWGWLVGTLFGLPGFLLSEPYCHFHSNYRKVKRTFLPEFNRRADLIGKAVAAAEGPEQVLQAVDRLLELTAELQQDVNQWSYSFATNGVWLLRLLVQRWAGLDMAAFKDLLRVPEANQTSRANAALEALVLEVQEDRELRRLFESEDSGTVLEGLARQDRFADFSRKFRAFMDAYGIRSSNRDFTFPRWRERPGEVVEHIRRSLDVEQRGSVDAERLMRGAEAAVEARLSNQVAGPFYRLVFRIVLRYTRIYIALREDLRFHLDRLFADYRAAFLKLGTTLVRDGSLGKKEQVFFLRLPEVVQIVGSGSQDRGDRDAEIHRRRVGFERSRRRQPYYYWVEGQGMNVQDDATLAADRLHGLGTSSGLKTGRARVIGGPEEFGDLEPDEVIVAVSTDPGWTPLFRRAGAVVTEIGGVLNHSSVVAREYDIPAVVGVQGATQHIRTGDVVTVDGSNGWVQVLSVDMRHCWRFGSRGGNRGGQ